MNKILVMVSSSLNLPNINAGSITSMIKHIKNNKHEVELSQENSSRFEH